MADQAPEPEFRFYGELATWWPLISPPEDYTEEAEFIGSVLSSSGQPVQEVLELGSGGGHNAVHLKQRFTMTLVDLSNDMLEVSRLLNPDCEHFQGDMRTVRLGRAFDGVFVHDAVDYMTSQEDLLRAVMTAFEHCRPGGIAVFIPDETAESFEESTDHGGRNEVDEDGLPLIRGIRYLEWTWDPDPTDSWVQTEYSFLLREADGSVRVLHETHRTGLFQRARWLEVLTAAGFQATSRPETTTEERPTRTVFIGHRPMF